MPVAAPVEISLPPLFPWQRRLRELVLSGLRTGKPKFISCVMGRRGGKSVALADIAGSLCMDEPGAKVFWGAHSQDGCTIGYELILGPLWTQTARGREVYSMFGPMVESSKIQPLGAVFRGGGRVYWRTLEGKGTSIGRGFRLAIIDEAARVPFRTVDQDLKYATADTGGPMIAITTPLGQRNWVHDWHQKALAGNPLYATVRGTTLENPNPLVQSFVESIREDVGEDDPIFRQEIMAEFLEDDGAVFENISSNARLEGWRDGPVEGGRYVLGVDLAQVSDWTRCVALELQTGEAHGYWGVRGMPFQGQVPHIRDFWRKWGGPVWLDATGVGKPMVVDLRQAGVPVTEVTFHRENKKDIVTALRIAMSRGDVAYPADESLVGELGAYTATPLPSGLLRYEAPSGKNDDFVTALMLAWWGRQQGLAWSSTGAGDYGWVA